MKEFTLSGPGWFDGQPDPVIWARQGAVAYFNPPARELARRMGWDLTEGGALPAPLAELEARGTESVSLAGERWMCRTAELEGGTLYQLVPAPEAPAVTLDRLSQIAGQLRTPLGNLIGASQLLAYPRADRTPEKTEQYRAIQRKNYHILLRMLDSLEFLGTISGEQLTWQPQILDFGGLCADVVRRVQGVCPQAGCTLTLDQRSGNLLVRGEERMLRRLLYQLLSNAIRAAGDSGQIVLRLEKRGGRWVRLTVSDSGRGFTPAQLARAFDPARGGDPLTEGEQGLGLGISICRTVAEKHDGRMALLSGDGGTAVVELPLCTDLTAGELHSPQDFSGGLNETLIQLADVLPWQCFLSDED